MKLLVWFLLVIIGRAIGIRIPGENVDKKTLTSLGIKTLDWQGENTSNSSFSQVRVHHNYSKVLVQNEGVRGEQQQKSQISDFGQIANEDYSENLGIQQIHDSQKPLQHGGQQTQTSFDGQEQDGLDFDDISRFFGNENDQTSGQFNQGEQKDLFPSQTTFGGQAEDNLLNLDDFSQNKFTDQSQVSQYQNGNYNSSDYNEQIYNAHSYGNTPQLEHIIKAENAIKNQQQSSFPDYDQTAESSNIEHEARQVKHFYPLDKPIYVHGFKYPPDPFNQQPIQPPPESHTKCPKSATGQFVYSLSCNQFLNCWNGRGYVQNCAPGTLFNPSTLECDFASKVKCITGPRKPGYVQQNQGSLKLETGCPAGFSGIVPHHTDCSKFINCANGAENVMDCPPGTLFSLKINSCDFPYKAECASWSVQFGNIKSTHSGGTNEGYQGGQNFNNYGQNYQSASGFGQKYISSQDFRQNSQFGFNLNQNQSGYGKIGTHSDSQQNYDQESLTNTNKNSQVSHSTYEQTHGQGLGTNIHPSFHQYVQQGNSDQNQQFGSGSLNRDRYEGKHVHDFYGGQNSGSQAQGNFESQNQNTGSVGSISSGKQGSWCHTGASGLYPHPHDCSKFLNCANGHAVVQDCGPGTVFNPDSKVCDFPYKVNCHNSQGTILHGQNLDTHSQYQQNTSGSISQNYDVSSQSSSAVHDSSTTAKTILKCPQYASGLYPHPTICSKFLNCANGQTFIQDCGPGTVFNPIIKVCDYPYNVDCGQNYGEDLIDVKKVPVTKKPLEIPTAIPVYVHGSTDNQFNSEDSYTNQQGLYEQNQGGDYGLNTQTQQGSYGQDTNTNYQGSYSNYAGQNQVHYGQGQENNQQQSSFGQTSTSQTQEGSYGQIPSNWNKHQTDFNQQGFRDQSQTDSNLHGQAISTSGNQEGFYGQTNLYGRNRTATKHQQGSYGQTGQAVQDVNQYGNSQTGEDQDLEETRNYNQGFHGSKQGQNINIDNQRQKWESQHGTLNQPKSDSHHSPSPFPSTDINADYEFGNEDVSNKQDVLKPAILKPKPKDGRKRKDFCEPFDFHCSVDDCLPQTMVCDGVKDCPNGADEQKCEKYLEEFIVTPNSILAVREKERFMNITLVYCAKSCLESKGFQCKSFSYRRDDGACFLSDMNVGLSGALIISHPYNYYETKSFTVNCTNHYKCPNQKCIRFKQVCDGINDCADRTDEKGCGAEALGYQIKLGGADKKHEGRIEVKAFGKWGYICDDKFGLRDADVACRELGFPLGSLEVKSNSYYAQDLDEKDVFYLMDDVSCLGNETTLRDCDFNGWGVNNCEAQEIVGIICKTPQETCPKNHWKCDTVQECLPLAFLCDGVFDCSDQSDEGSQHCEAPTEIRLAGGSFKYEGRIEIRHFGIWGTICDDDFNDDAAKVVCKYLGYPGKATAKKDGHFGPGSGPIWLDQVFCQGNESSIEYCIHWNWGEHNCEHGEDVGVVCSNVYDNLESVGSERSVQIDQRTQLNDILPDHLFPERCGLRKDDQFLEEDNIHFRVVQGSIAKKGDYPWQASLRIKNKSKPAHWCGAVVISQKFVLTAAHCLTGFAKGAYFVVAGDYDTDNEEGTEQEAYIEEFYIHQYFRIGQKMNNDIALVKLKGEGLTFTKDVQPICLPESDTVYETGINCTISGFGTTQSGVSTFSHQLRAGWIPIQPKAVCQMPHVYGDMITDGMICAGSLDEGVDACEGDSGGPLACLHEGFFTLYGLTSWGQHCGHANKPGVYVKIAYYRKWIDDTIRKYSK